MTFGNVTDVSGTFLKQCARVAFSAYEARKDLEDMENVLTVEGGGRPASAKKPHVFESAGKIQVAIWRLFDGKTDYNAIGIRGTSNLENSIADLDCGLADLDDEKNNLFNTKTWSQRPQIHSGFLKSFRILREDIRSALATSAIPILVTGHSLGGALATLIGLDLAMNPVGKLDTESLGPQLPNSVTPNLCVVTFGKPQVGDQTFCELFNEAFMCNSINVNVHIMTSADPVTWIARLYNPAMKHEGKCVDIDRWNQKISDFLCAILKARPNGLKDILKVVKKFSLEELHSCKNYWRILSGAYPLFQERCAEAVRTVYDQVQDPTWALAKGAQAKAILDIFLGGFSQSRKAMQWLLSGNIYLAAGTVFAVLPFTVAAFKVASCVSITLGAGITLVDGTHYFTSGHFSVSLQQNQAVVSRHGAATQNPPASFPERLTEGANNLSFHARWGMPSGCSGFLCYRIEGCSPPIYAIFVINNPFFRNSTILKGNSLAVAVCLSDCPLGRSAKQAHRLVALAKKDFSTCGFAGKRVTGRIGTVSVSSGGFNAWGQMTNFRIQAASFGLSRDTAAQRDTVMRPQSFVPDCSAIQTSLRNFDLAGALELAARTDKIKRRASDENGGCLRLVNQDNLCARFMTARYTLDGATKTQTDKGKVILLPRGARNVKVKFWTRSMAFWSKSEATAYPVWQVDRSHSAQPWKKEDGKDLEEVLDIGDGDGVHAVFVLRGWMASSYVHQAWDFGRGTNCHRDWEWLANDEEKEAKAIELLKKKATS